MSERERKASSRKRRRQARARKRKRSERSRGKGQTRGGAARGRYADGRRFVAALKVFVGVGAALLVFDTLVSTIWMSHKLPDSGTGFLLFWSWFERTAIILMVAAFVFAVLLGIEAVFDIGDDSRESLSTARTAREEAEFAGVMLSEISEALGEDEEEEEEGEDERESEEPPGPLPSDGEE